MTELNRGATTSMAEHSVTVENTLQTLLNDKKYSTIRDILVTMNPADIAAVFAGVEPEKLPLLFRLLPKELAAESFVEMESEEQEALIKGISDKELRQVMDELYEAARALGGEVSGEHGIGHAKRDFLYESLGETQMNIMRGIKDIYRIHQFEKQEMIVICKPEESMEWFHKMWSYSVELFRSMDIPVRTLECCTGDLADLKVKSYDVEAWSPKQQKYFEVCSCSNLGDAQARRLGIRVKSDDGKKYLAHTLNNTVVAPPRMLIAFLENNLEFDGEKYSVRIPEALRPYMGGMERIVEK